MHTSLHPSHWFHHAAMPDTPRPGPQRLRAWLHNGAFWATVVLIAVVCALFVLAIISSGTVGNGAFAPVLVP